MEIHPSAVVDSRAELAQGVKVGPYSVIGEHVKIGSNTVIGANVVIEGHVEVGERNRISPFVSIGAPPQDIGYQGEETRVTIGNDNIIREYTSINRATTKQDRVTVVGNKNYLMAYSHVGHDCILGDSITMANLATLGGHTEVGDYASMAGLVASHQFVRIGAYSFIGGNTGIPRDIPPFMLALGQRAKLYGLNLNGLKRHGFSKDVISGLKKAYMIIWRESKIFKEGIKRVREEIEPFPELDMLLEFISDSKRGITH